MFCWNAWSGQWKERCNENLEEKYNWRAENGGKRRKLNHVCTTKTVNKINRKTDTFHSLNLRFKNLYLDRTIGGIFLFSFSGFWFFFCNYAKKTCMTKNDLNVSSIIHSFASFGKKTKTNYNNSLNCEHIFESLWGRLLNAHLKYETNSDICKFGLFKQRRAALKKDDERVWKSLVNRKITIEISQFTMISATAPFKKKSVHHSGLIILFSYPLRFCLLIIVKINMSKSGPIFKIVERQIKK